MDSKSTKIAIFVNHECHNHKMQLMLFCQNKLRIKRLGLLVFLLLGVSYIFSAPLSIGGLYFYSHQEIKDKRTSLALSPHEPLYLSKGFNLEFDLNVRNENSIFGYVCRIVANDSVNIDILLSNSNDQDEFWLLCGNDKKQLILLKDIPKFSKGQWIHVKLSYLPLEKSFELSLNKIKRKILLSASTPVYDKFEIYFGVNEHPRFFTTDAAPVILRDIKISNLSNKLLYHWTLKEHGDSVVYDGISHLKAKVNNPFWVIDSHVHWQIFDSLEVSEKPLIAYNSLKSDLYVVEQSYMIIYHLGSTKGVDTIYYKKGNPYHTMANQLIYNNFTNELWSYDFDSSILSKYNFKTNTWSISAGNTREPTYWHHNALISPVDSSLVCFGGYGYYTYHSDLLKYNQTISKWKTYPLNNFIQPRYLAASALQGNEMYIFGGFGNKTGQQQFSPHTFCDLYSVSLNDFTVKKRWSMELLEGIVQSRSMVFDENGSDMYTLGYSGNRFNTWMHLYKLNKNKEGLTALADSIPYKFSDTGSYSDLFFVSDKQCFVALTLNRTLENKYKIILYSLNYPTFPLSEIIQTNDKTTASFTKDMILFISLSLLFVLNIFILTLWLKRRRNNKNTGSVLGFDTEGNENQTINPSKLYANFTKLVIKKQIIPSSISLVGGFQVINRTGADITALFTPTVKNMLLLILLYTYKNNKGISSIPLDEILWFDKSETSARNNRNVNINKLHSLLEEIDGFSINNDNTYWRTDMKHPFVCDYIILMDFAKRIKDKNISFSEDDLSLVLSMASQGLLLPNVQTDWVDPFKAEYSTIIIDALLELAKQADDSQNFKLLIQVAEVILIQDSIDEDALIYKCKSLVKLGKKSAALSFYNNFCRDYKLILNDNFPHTFNDLIK